jgi:hypothetical protein
MRRLSSPRALLLVSSGWLFPLACGSRTGLPPGRLIGEAGAEGFAGAPVEPMCVTAADCPQPPPDRCGSAACTDGVCSLDMGQVCDDKDPCTVDSCVTGGCVFTDGRVDADGDGAFATGTSADPKAALGCGKDCDDTSPDIFPGAIELCDGLDNDCNGVIDDGTQLQPSKTAPTRVSPPDAEHSQAAGLAFDGESFGATMTSWFGRSQGQFQQIDLQGKLVGGPQRIARVNAQDYAGPLLWSGERYLTAYEDARQDGNYEIYFDLLNRKGERIIPDLRVTNADDYSLRPSVLWTGAEALLIWDDRRFEKNGDHSVIFGQRVSLAGQLLGANTRISAPGTRAEKASAALTANEIGIAFLALDDQNRASLQFMTTSRTFDKPSAAKSIAFEDPDSPNLTALNDEYVITFHQDTGALIGSAIYGAVVQKNGAVSVPQSMTTGAAHARGNSTYSYGDRFVMVWADDRTGNYQLYAQTFDKKLSPISQLLRLTNTNSLTLDAALAPSSDGGLGVLYSDQGNGDFQTFFTRLDCTAAFQLK